MTDTDDDRIIRAWAARGVDWVELDEPTREVLRQRKTLHPLPSTVPSVRGHSLRMEYGAGWCACGAYMGGLGCGGDDQPPRERHELHRAVVLASRAAEDRASSLF